MTTLEAETMLPPGYHLEDTAIRSTGRRYSISNDTISTDTLMSKQPVLSIGWLMDLSRIVDMRYREGYPWCRITYTGSGNSTEYHRELQTLLREIYDFPGQFGSTYYGVRVEFAPNTTTVYIHIPFPTNPR